MSGKSVFSNWTLMIAYTVVLVLGIIAASFLMAFYWRIDSITRVDPSAADYRADHPVALAPLSTQIVMAARRDIGDGLIIDDLNPGDKEEQEPSLPSATLKSVVTQTLTPSANPTAAHTATQTPIPSLPSTETQTETATLTSTSTLEPTQGVTQDTSTPKPTKKPTSSAPNPTATQEPRPTQPPPTATSKPKPTKTSDPYPPPRPYP